MLVPSTITQLGRRSFHVAAPAVCNTLPSHLRSPSISRGQFRAGLKTHLFTQAYGHLWELLLKSVFFTLHYIIIIKFAYSFSTSRRRIVAINGQATIDIPLCGLLQWGLNQQLCGRPPQYTSAPFDLWPWKWCPSHVWHGLPLCQF